jgi:uncharacterized protein (DUF924 family)
MMNSSLITKLTGILIIVFSLNVFAHTESPDKMIDEILNYWFDYHHHSEPLYDRQFWWDKNDKTDHFIKNKFGEIRKQAIKGELNHWLNSTKGKLAYVILIDQFSRNIYRNTPEMFENDELARAIIKKGIKNGDDKQLTLTERVFFYLPLEHSEDLNDQNQSILLFEKLYEDTPSHEKANALNFLNYAKQHRDVIRQFNRFPHRNVILKRESTPEELLYLKTHPGF